MVEQQFSNSQTIIQMSSWDGQYGFDPRRIWSEIVSLYIAEILFVILYKIWGW